MFDLLSASDALTAAPFARPPWIGLVCPPDSMDAQIDQDLGNVEVKITPEVLCSSNCSMTSFASWELTLFC